MTDVHDALLTTNAAAKYLSVKKTTLETWRYQRQGPPYIKLGSGPRAPIRYRQSELQAYLQRSTVSHVGE